MLDLYEASYAVYLYQICWKRFCFFVYTGRDFQLDLDRNLVTVTNNASDRGRCFRIIISEDSASETTEQFNINCNVSSVQPEGVNINTSSEAIIFIQDDDGKSLYWAR